MRSAAKNDNHNQQRKPKESVLQAGALIRAKANFCQKIWANSFFEQCCRLSLAPELNKKLIPFRNDDAVF